MSRRGSRIAVAAAIAAVLIGTIRIASTWKLFTETYDEANHIACGMEWLSAGRYTYETKHPPLARVMLALGPRLAGASFHNQPSMDQEGRMILDQAPDYLGRLAQARAGNLLFFVLACFAVWHLGRQCGGAAAAAASVALFTLIPVVLGHAGMATNDMAAVACVGLAFWSWQAWLDRPRDARRAAFAGAATALAVLAKFSAVMFLPAALAAGLLVRGRRQPESRTAPGIGFRTLACAAAAFVLVAWAGYRFELLPVRTPPGRQFLLLDHLIGSAGWLHGLIYRLLEVPLPLTGLVKGLGELFQHNWDGHPAYLLGQVSLRGWWYFFPVALAVKTPLAFLLLAVLGAVVAIRERNRPAMMCLAAALGVLVVSLPSNVNIGVRHVLPMYLFVAPLAGVAVVRGWRWRGLLVPALCVWMAAGSAMAHPFYLADFNLLARGKPEKILLDSDLDWGQDLRFATNLLRQRGAREVWIAYSGIARPEREPGIAYRRLPSETRVTGWLAISVRRLYFDGAWARAAGKAEPYGWIKTLTPVARAGRSILIFDLRGASSAQR